MEGDVESIMEKGEEGMQHADGFIRQMSSGKTYTQGTDRYGRPVVYVHVAKHRTWDQVGHPLYYHCLVIMLTRSPPVSEPQGSRGLCHFPNGVCPLLVCRSRRQDCHDFRHD